MLGSPVAHSLSPVMHRAAYAELGLDWTYEAFDVDEAALPDFVDGLDARWRGLSLTMPLKRAVLSLTGVEVDDVARRVGGANTLVLEDGRRRAYNTDVGGAAAALAERGVGPVRTAAVLGAGATAASVLAALAGSGLERAVLLVREPSRAEAVAGLARSWGLRVDVRRLGEVPDEVDLLVSTLPGSAGGGAEVAALAGVAGAVFDVAYDPWPTPLAREAERLGRTVVGGLDLLAHQAVAQVALTTGGSVDVTTLRDAALASLG